MILIFSIFMQIIFFYSAIDIHFPSIDLAMNRTDCSVTVKASAKRLVFFISDGLSADLLYTVTAKMGNSSFVRSIMEEHGSWGVSHNFIPTISKPGFLAMTTGSKFDASQFWHEFRLGELQVDHIFNYVKHVFYSGDPDVPHYFNNTIIDQWFLHTWTNNFFAKNADTNHHLFDNFACDHFNELFKNPKMKDQLHRNNIIFLVYMVAVDYCGHDFGPNSNYCESIVENLDRNLKAVHSAFAEFYKDNETAFILTSDHGMTNARTHGGAEKLALESPILAWGAGIRSGGGIVVESPSAWNVTNLSRVDVDQFDLAPTMSIVLGNRIPTHSTGMVQRSLLDLDEDEIAKALYCNQWQMHEMVVAQSKATGDSHILHNLNGKTGNVTSLIKRMEHKLKRANKLNGILMAENLITIHRKQLQLYKNYFRVMIWVLLSLIFVGWGLWLVERVLTAVEGDKQPSDSLKSIWNKVRNERNPINSLTIENILRVLFDFLILLFCFLLIGIVYWKNWPHHFIVYFLVMITVWWRVIINVDIFKRVLKKRGEYFYSLLYMVLTSSSTAGVILAVNSPTARQFVILLMTLFQYFIILHHKIEPVWQSLWITSSVLVVIMCRYEIINLPKEANFIHLGSMSWIFFILLYLYYNRGSLRNSLWTFLFLIMIIISSWNVFNLHFYSQEKDLYPGIILSWIILALGPTLPILASHNGLERLCHLCFSLASTFILLSVRHEALGLMAFSAHLMVWYCVELKMSGRNFSGDPSGDSLIWKISPKDLLRSYFLLVYIWCGYFIIGNTDYLKSYDIKWTKCFVESFQIVEVTFLIVYKILMPILILCSTFAMLYKYLRIDRQKTIEWYLFLNNIVLFYFFHCTKGESYRPHEMAFSLVHLTLASLFPIIVVLFLPLTNKLNQLCTVIKLKQRKEPFISYFGKIPFQNNKLIK